MLKKEFLQKLNILVGTEYKISELDASFLIKAGDQCVAELNCNTRQITTNGIDKEMATKLEKLFQQLQLRYKIVVGTLNVLEEWNETIFHEHLYTVYSESQAKLAIRQLPPRYARNARLELLMSDFDNLM